MESKSIFDYKYEKKCMFIIGIFSNLSKILKNSQIEQTTVEQADDEAVESKQRHDVHSTAAATADGSVKSRSGASDVGAAAQK